MAEHTAELVTVKGRQYLIIDKYIALRIDALAEAYSRKYGAWRKSAGPAVAYTEAGTQSRFPFMEQDDVDQ